MDLVLEGLDVLGGGVAQIGLELGHRLGRLVLGGEQDQRDADALGLGRVDHGWVDLGADHEGVGVGAGGGEGDDFAAPAVLLDGEEVVS